MENRAVWMNGLCMKPSVAKYLLDVGFTVRPNEAATLFLFTVVFLASSNLAVVMILHLSNYLASTVLSKPTEILTGTIKITSGW